MLCAKTTKCSGSFKKPLHLVVLVRNFLAVDSTLYDPNDPNAVLTCIQITRNEEHPISVRHIQGRLKLGTPLDDLRPSENRAWRFLFVVPFGMASNFELQRFKGDTDKGEWARKAHQCELGLEEQTIFRRGSDSSIQRATTSQQGEQQLRC